MDDGNVTDFIAERVRRGLGPTETPKTTDNRGGDGDGGTPDMSDIGDRLSKLEGSFDVFKVLISVMAAVMLGGFAFLGTQIARLDTKIEGNTQRLNDKIDANYTSLNTKLDGTFASLNTKLDGSETKLNDKLDSIPQQLAEEFRAVRAEMSAQTAAIAGAVTAAKQVPPQVLLIPAPAVEAPAPKP